MRQPSRKDLSNLDHCYGKFTAAGDRSSIFRNADLDEEKYQSRRGLHFRFLKKDESDPVVFGWQAGHPVK
jgi:hypothetical protein